MHTQINDTAEIGKTGHLHFRKSSLPQQKILYETLYMYACIKPFREQVSRILMLNLRTCMAFETGIFDLGPPTPVQCTMYAGSVADLKELLG